MAYRTCQLLGPIMSKVIEDSIGWNSGGGAHGGTYYKSPAVEAKNTFSYIVMQEVRCLKFCNMTKSGGGGQSPRDLRPWKIDCLRQKCGPENVGFSAIQVMVIFAEVSENKIVIESSTPVESDNLILCSIANV